MLLKRFYKIPPGWEKKVDKDGNCTNPPPLDYVSIGHTGTTPEQNFSDHFVAGAIKEGWLSIGAGKIVLHVHPEDLVYRIVRTPGFYCCHCGAGAASQVDARAHVVGAHAGKKSPDANNPAGYRRLNGYECVLEAAQHKKWKNRGPKRAVSFPRKGEVNANG